MCKSNNEVSDSLWLEDLLGDKTTSQDASNLPRFDVSIKLQQAVQSAVLGAVYNTHPSTTVWGSYVNLWRLNVHLAPLILCRRTTLSLKHDLVSIDLTSLRLRRRSV